MPSIRLQLRAGGGGGKLSLASLAVHALAPHSAAGADGGVTTVHADAPHSVVLADGGAPAVLACAPPSVVLADGGAPAVLALALASAMRAFRSRLRHPGPLLPPLRLRLLPSPPLPACRFPRAPAPSALAPLLAMPTLVLFTTGTTAPSSRGPRRTPANSILGSRKPPQRARRASQASLLRKLTLARAGTTPRQGARQGVTRQGVVLTDLQSLRDCQ